jgi:subtilase family serine protease
MKLNMLSEMLESRVLLSAIQPGVIVLPQAAPSSGPDGYSPAQIKHAYGFDQISFDNGTVAGDGTGQTIAIVDAFDDPNVGSDLHVFDNKFGLPAPPSLRVVNQTGGNMLPAEDPGWASEISLDVEWALAIAPGANIVLVETNSDSISDLMAGVLWARQAKNVSVVSISWGGSEFVDIGTVNPQSQTQFDSEFTTPANHPGVTFVAAAGDEGQATGIEWPASSPNVLSVGGTTLMLADDGTYESETGWNGTSGGYSTVETEPVFQEGAETTGSRSGPDVAYDADPNTGIAIYDSIEDQGESGWQVVGGTSAATPQWVGLIAIADQGRVLSGGSTLDGVSQTLPALYSLYSPPNTAGYSSYTAAFNDIISGGQDGRLTVPATAGYDIVTGLGSPHAEQIVTTLESAAGGTFTPQSLLPSPITGVFAKGPPVSVVGGTAGAINLRLVNSSGLRFTGSVSVTLYASADSSLSSDDTVLETLPVHIGTIVANGIKGVTLRFTYPPGFEGSSADLIASISTTSIATDPATAVAPGAVAIATPTVDLAASYTAKNAVLVRSGKPGNVTIRIQNLGNVAAIGTLSAELNPSLDGVTDFSTLLGSIANRKIRIGAGKFITLTLHFIDPSSDIGGAFDLVASITSVTVPADDNSADDAVTIPTRAPA